MSKVRSGGAINTDAMTNPVNTLIVIEGGEVEHFSKPEDKGPKLTAFTKGELDSPRLFFVWTGKTRSDVFELTKEDANRILGN